MENKGLRNALIYLACGMLLWGAGMFYFYGKAENKAQQNRVSKSATIQQQQADIDLQIFTHYEKIDSLNHVRDSINIVQRSKPVKQLQADIDSIFNR